MVKVSISKTVQHLVEHDLAIQNALERNYGNYSAIARLLKPKVERINGKKVTTQALITAVKRARTSYVNW